MIPGWCFTTRHHDEDAWWSARPDVTRYNQLRDEMGERVSNDEPPQGKDRPEVHPWFAYALKVGWPAALSTSIIAWVLYYTPTILDLLRQIIASMALMQADHIAIRDRLDRYERTQSVMVDILRAQCWNDAKTAEARERCRDAGTSR
jgi:hypothetical protein